MPDYLLQASYTHSSISAMVQNPHDRRQLIRGVISKLGGSLEGMWLSFGDYDVVLVCRMPDAEGMAALSMAISAGGAVKSLKTTPLLSWEEGMHAMARADNSGYRPPHVEEEGD